jgi:DNA-binding transcriptional regulator YiaG
LLLIADEHPAWRIKNYRLDRLFSEVIRSQPSAEEVKELRVALGMKQQEIADLLGYTLAAWKSKQKRTPVRSSPVSIIF